MKTKWESGNLARYGNSHLFPLTLDNMQKAALIDISLLKENPDNPRTHRRQFFGCCTCHKVFYSNKLDKARVPKYCSRECYSASLGFKIKDASKLFTKEKILNKYRYEFPLNSEARKYCLSRSKPYPKKQTSDSSITANAVADQATEEGQHHPIAQNNLPLTNV